MYKKKLTEKSSSGETPSRRMTFVRGTDEEDEGKELDKVPIEEGKLEAAQ
jgi:hypothetical protein